MKTQRSFAVRVSSVLLILLVTWSGAVTQGPELPDPGRVGMTKEQQEQLGLKAMAEVYKQMPVLPDSSPVTRYVQDLGRRLETVIPSQYSWPYQFHVVQQKEINAFALPGGPIFINVGTINAADNEAELAGVMAHEMSHVYMQHSAKQMPKQEWAGILSALGGLLGGGIGSLARAGIQFGAGTLLMKYSRNDEAQADSVGAVIMYRAGYDPKQMAEFFQKLEQQAGNGGPQFLSDHPNPGNRVAAVEKEIQDWPSRRYLATSQQFVNAKQEAARTKSYSAQQIADGAQRGLWAQQNVQSGAVPKGLPVDESEGPGSRGGGTLNNVSLTQIRPSSSFTQLRGRDFAIAYPDNWRAFQDSNSGGVTIAPPTAVAQGSIAYGVIMSAATPNANTLDDATQDLVQTLEQSNAGLRATGSPRPVSVNGVNGRSVDLVGTSPVQQNGQPMRERDWLITLPRQQGDLLYVVFVAPERDFDQLRPTYEKMLQSLQVR